MASLKLLYGDKLIDQYAVEYGFPLTIGRRESNHIVISNLAVSGLHAKVEYNQDGIFLIDLDSKNGTFVNGKASVKCKLNDGDEIVIGKHKMIFSETEAGKRLPVGSVAPVSKSLDETMVLDTNKHRDMIASLSAGPQAPAKPKPPTPVLMYITGGQGKVVLDNKFTRIGKDSTNEIVIKGLLIGARSASVNKRQIGRAHV
jgi:pSer/pThr/pTyr-binding forkhead associated (FHA) protein